MLNKRAKSAVRFGFLCEAIAMSATTTEIPVLGVGPSTTHTALRKRVQPMTDSEMSETVGDSTMHNRNYPYVQVMVILLVIGLVLLLAPCEVVVVAKVDIGALVEAADEGRIEALRNLLSQVGDVEAIKGSLGEALVKASIKGHTKVVKLLLDNGVDANSADAKGYSALEWACAKGRIEVARLLIGAGADVNARSKSGTTALSAASEIGRADIVRFLLEKGADVRIKTAHRTSALMSACMLGHLEVVKLLLNHGADLNEKTTVEERTPLMWAARAGAFRKNAGLDITKYLISKGADVDARDKHGNTALMHAASAGDIGVVSLLLAEPCRRQCQEFMGLDTASKGILERSCRGCQTFGQIES
jgi:ankyrin repeat protein